ncbi:MAG TPA: hypothetical protein VHH15_19275 [Actinophytocola sp.]|nr:hypothetical protein [Actinophytocola sp.]
MSRRVVPDEEPPWRATRDEPRDGYAVHGHAALHRARRRPEPRAGAFIDGESWGVPTALRFNAGRVLARWRLPMAPADNHIQVTATHAEALGGLAKVTPALAGVFLAFPT